MIRWDELSYSEKSALSLSSPAALSKWLNPERTIARHVQLISDTVTRAVHESMATRKGRIVLIEAPPGHAKSDTISVHTPLWFLSKWSDRNVALGTYGHEKAAAWGRHNRDLITENEDQMVLRLRADSKAKHHWLTQEGGGLLCTGVGGPLTGFRAHMLIIDDPIKDAEEANSETMREKTWEWYTTVALTRCWPEAVVIVLMTRWHHDDLIGRIKENYAEALKQGRDVTPVECLRLPCLADSDDDPLGRDGGQALWPSIYDEEWASRKQTDVGSRAWQALYQQNPTPDEGGMFKREYFNYFTESGDWYEMPGYRVLKRNCRFFQTVDTAMKETQQSDYTVISTFALTPDARLLVVDVQRERLEVPRQWPMIRRRIRDARRMGRYLWTAVEDKGSGIGLIQTARKMGVPLRTLKADRDKVTRATPASVWYENGMVYHRQEASWVGAFESELLNFPNGKHDDQVDTVAYAVLEMSTRKSAMASPDPNARYVDRDPVAADLVPTSIEF